MVYISENGRFCGMLPLACVLSAYGAHHAALTVIHSDRATCLAPELTRAVRDADQIMPDDLDTREQCDNYALAAIVLQSMVQASSSSMQETLGEKYLPEAPADFLRRALHSEPEWRIQDEQCLQHQWLLAAK